MPSRVSRARRRCSGTCAEVTRLPSGWMSSGASSSAGSPSAARRRRSRSRSGDAGAAPRVSSASSSGPTPASTSGRATRSCPAMTAFSRKYRRSSSSSASASPGERLDEPGVRGHPAVDLGRGVVVVQDDLRARHPVDRRHRVVGVGDHQEREVRRAEERRQPEVDRRDTVAGDGAGGHEVEVRDRLVELRVQHRPQRPPDGVAHGHACAPAGVVSSASCSPGCSGIDGGSGSRHSCGTSMP